MMKKIIYILIGLLGFISCGENEDLGKSCNYDELPLGFDIEGNTIIPLNSRNFWVYSDSLFEAGIFESEKSTLLIPEGAYDLDGLISIKFSEIIPQLTVRNDTLFTTIWTIEPTAPNCYEILHPLFFSTTDTVQLDDGFNNEIIYPSAEPIETPTGIYSNNIIYRNGEFYEIVIHEGVGIIRISFFLFDDNNQKIKRRVLSLKDYDLN